MSTSERPAVTKILNLLLHLIQSADLQVELADLGREQMSLSSVVHTSVRPPP